MVVAVVAVWVLMGPMAWAGETAPRRVVALAPSLTEIVYALGRGDLLVGAAAYSDYPEAAKALPRVGSYAQPDLERVLALHPDCCLAVDDMTPKDAIVRLRALGLPVHELSTRDLAAVLASIDRIGELLGARERAGELVADMRRTMERVASRRGDGERPRVLYQIGLAPMYAACGDTFIDTLIDLAGGRNVCAAMKGYPLLTREQAVAFRPDVILIPTMGREPFEAAKAQWQAWGDVPAVRDGRIYILDSDMFDRPGPRVAKGLEELGRLLAPAAGRTAEARP